MITYFCDNPKCKNHINIRRVSLVKQIRHKYNNNNYFCEACHNVIEMKRKLQNQKHIY